MSNLTNPDDFRLRDPSQVITPCLLVYPKTIRKNLEESIKIAGDVGRLRPHVKTHKTAEIVRIALELGISKHKCATLAEAQLLGRCETPDVLIAYPQVGPAIARFAALVSEFPKTNFSVTVDCIANARQLAEHFLAKELCIDVLVDIDTGMHRTGLLPGKDAYNLYRFVDESNAFNAAGLHVYDGQNHQPPLAERRAAVDALMEPIVQLVATLNESGHAVPKLVCGGTPTFPVFANLQIPDLESSIECSPGTCLLSDHGYGSDYQDMDGISYAAVVMTRVISKQPNNRVTLDLGHKAIAADPPAGNRCYFPHLPDAKEIKQNEEHLVIETNQAPSLEVGDELYAVPTHICPTVAVHSHMHAVEDGRIVGIWPVAARHRLYS